MKLITRLSILSLLCASILPASATLLNIYTLPGSQETTIWTNLSSGNTGLVPASGTGTLGVLSPAFRHPPAFIVSWATTRSPFRRPVSHGMPKR